MWIQAFALGLARFTRHLVPVQRGDVTASWAVEGRKLEPGIPRVIAGRPVRSDLSRLDPPVRGQALGHCFVLQLRSELQVRNSLPYPHLEQGVRLDILQKQVNN